MYVLHAIQTYIFPTQLMYKVVTKIKKCKRMLHSWIKDHFGNVKNQIKKKKELLWKALEASAKG